MVATDTFVGRQKQLARLEALLEQALAGAGQTCFVLGEAGSGKTSLVAEFAQRAQERNTHLVTVTGQCNAQTGTGDPYLPFREILDLLTGDVETKLEQGSMTRENAHRLRSLVSSSTEALLEVGPDLLGLFVPWVGLALRLSTFAAEKTGLMNRVKGRFERDEEHPRIGDLDQSQIFEQYANVIRALATRHPLVIVLDDLQWADASSIELLFHLSRRIPGAAILIVGTYRPAEVAFGRAGAPHPLEKVLTELKRYHGDIFIDLNQAQESEGRLFVDALLDRRPNRFGNGFRAALLRHADGNPLFTVELLRDMEERGDIVRDAADRWVASPNLDWTRLPKRVEGVIEERVRRLDPASTESLVVGSVEGVDFTAEVVATIIGVRARDLVRRLSRELDRRHRLIQSQGVRRVGSRRISRYQFRHHLFQQYLYGTIDEVERAYLHDDVGCTLQKLYGEQAQEISVQLARHFVIADRPELASHYLTISGERAATRYANEEAISHLTQALSLTPEEDPEARYRVLLVREHVRHVQGDRAAQERDLDALQNLAETLRDPKRQTEVALRRGRWAEAISDYGAAVEEAQAALHLAEQTGDTAHQATGRLQWGRALWHRGDYQSARLQLERALELSREAAHPSVAADCLNNLGIVHWYQSGFEEAESYLKKALPIKREAGDRQGEGDVLTNLAGVAYQQGRYEEAVAYQEEALQIYRSTGYQRGVAMALCNLGAFLLECGEYGRAREFVEASLPVCEQIEDREGVVASHINLGTISLYLGDYLSARTELEEALTLSRETEDYKGETEALIYLSLLDHYTGNDSRAARRAEEALALAREAGDRTDAAHALTHLGHALSRLGDVDKARTAYREAVAQRHALGEDHRAIEPLAGLARLSLARERPDQALSLVERILDFLAVGSLDGADEPLRVYLTCHQVLEATQDRRARSVMTAARDLLRERLAAIDEPELRRSFLARPASRELLGGRKRDAPHPNAADPT
jgi:tetratricopeptide (TPR) repeat protein